MMKEIRVHARAGQGAITTAMLLATAAFEDGKHALAFPSFGAQRMGAPMNAFVRIGDIPIRVRSQINEPDYVLVQDSTLLRGYDVVAGLKPDGVALINDARKPSELGLKTKAKVLTIQRPRLLWRPSVVLTVLTPLSSAHLPQPPVSLVWRLYRKPFAPVSRAGRWSLT